MITLVAIFVLLLGCSAFFSGSETALFSLTEVKLRSDARLHVRTRDRLLEFLQAPREMLVTILTGNLFVNIGISIVGAALLNRVASFGVKTETLLSVVIITPILLVFGEVVPKNVSLRFARRLAPAIIWPLRFFAKLIHPFVVVFTWIADRIVVLFGGSPQESLPMMREDDFRRLVDLGRKEGVIVEEERELIHNVFDFSDKTISHIMTPAGRIFALSTERTDEEIMEAIRGKQFSRIPFYATNPEKVVGILHVRDLFAFDRRRRRGEEVSVAALLRPPLFVQPETPLEELLREFQSRRVHMGLVRDEGGALVGIVTMHDVLEELFGEIEE